MKEFFEAIQNSIPSSVIDVVLRLVFAALVLLIGLKLINFVTKKMSKVSRTKNLDESALSFVKSALGITCKVIVVVTAAAILGVPLTAIVTLLGSAGLAIGLALQGSLSNFAGGLMILIFRPFSVGDYISNHTDEGTVEGITIFYTSIRTIDNRRIVLPNGTLSNSSVINYSSYPTRRVDTEFAAAYGSDIDKVISVIVNTASGIDGVLTETPVEARLLRQDSSALTFICRAWCAAPDYWNVKFALNEEMKKAFDKAGIEIPFTQIDVHSK